MMEPTWLEYESIERVASIRLVSRGTGYSQMIFDCARLPMEESSFSVITSTAQSGFEHLASRKTVSAATEKKESVRARALPAPYSYK